MTHTNLHLYFRKAGHRSAESITSTRRKLFEYEEGDQTVSVAADIPEERRVWLLAMEFDYDRGELEAEFLSKPGEDFQRTVERICWVPAGV